MKKEIFAIIFATVYLVIYTVAAHLGVEIELIFLMFFLSPFLLMWTVITVLKAKAPAPDPLKDDEEWGYQDVNKEDLGVF